MAAVIAAAVAAALSQWKTEVSDRNALNRSFAKLPADSVTHLRHVVRMPAWRRRVLSAAVASCIVRASVSRHPQDVQLVCFLTVLLAFATSQRYHNWHILCHANCM